MILDPIAELRTSAAFINSSEHSSQDLFILEAARLRALGVKSNALTDLDTDIYLTFPHVTAIWLLGQIVNMADSGETFDPMVWVVSKQTWLGRADDVLEKFKQTEDVRDRYLMLRSAVISGEIPVDENMSSLMNDVDTLLGV